MISQCLNFDRIVSLLLSTQQSQNDVTGRNDLRDLPHAAAAFLCSNARGGRAGREGQAGYAPEFPSRKIERDFVKLSHENTN
jgi:hypothetical protein